MPKAVFVQPDGSEKEIDVARMESLMRAAVRCNVDGVVAECGGALTCATCHVYVDAEWADRLPPPERFVTTGEQAFRELDGRTYLETGTKRGSRFAVRFHLPEKAALCCFEWDYPDDAYRIADIIVQPVNAGSESLKQHGESDIHDYQLQVGYLTGDEYPNQNRMLTARCLY